MAGKRQHYLPRLLQRGFLHDRKDDAERTWLHRRGTEARLVGIRSVGVEDWFYSRKSLDGAPTLDDLITDLEQDLGTSVAKLRAISPGSAVSSEETARTVVHLVMRTAHLRQVMSIAMASIFDEVQTLFSDSDRLGKMIGLTEPSLASAVSEMIRDKAKEMVPLGIPAGLSERLATFTLRELGDKFVEQTATTVGSLLPHVLGGLTGKIRDAHNSMLAKSAESSGWLKVLATFGWKVEDGENFILPDVVALAREPNGPLVPLLLSKSSDVSVVIMPIAHNRILVGRRSEIELIDRAEFNKQAAANCEAFFVGSKPFGDQLIQSIGSGPANNIQNMIAGAIREAEQARSKTDLARFIPPRTDFVEAAFAFSLRLADFGDEVLVKEFADVLKGMVGALARDLPLHELDGFTLAVDYRGALAMLDRGSPDLHPITSEARGYGLGVGMPVAVIRDGIRKTHLVVAFELAQMWLSSEAELRATGLYTLAKMLAGIAHSTRYSVALEAGVALDPIGRELHLAVASAPASYWSARQAAFLAPDQAQVLANLVVDSLDFVEREIEKERARIPESGDIGVVVGRALEVVSAVLSHAADWLGHRDGLVEGQKFSGDDLPDRLRARGLDRWVELFGRDLAACYADEDALNLGVVVHLSSHVERLLWSFGVYCWPDADSVRCVVTDRFFRTPPI